MLSHGLPSENMTSLQTIELFLLLLLTMNERHETSPSFNCVSQGNPPVRILRPACLYVVQPTADILRTY